MAGGVRTTERDKAKWDRAKQDKAEQDKDVVQQCGLEMPRAVAEPRSAVQFAPRAGPDVLDPSRPLVASAAA